jgi:predicted DNA-binding transcriptional regulator
LQPTNAPKDELKGTTLRVYRFILRARRPARIGDIQRALGLSSSSLVQYHVKKLIDLGVIKEEQTGYVVVKVLAENVFRIRRRLVPFQVAYVVFLA